MNKNSDPIQYLIKCCEDNIAPTQFDILNAKDQLNKLKVDSDGAYKQRWLDAETERAKLSEENKMLKADAWSSVVAWTKINSRGDLYDLRLQYNPHEEHISMPLYANKEELKAIVNKLKNA